jgi:hypothetical protein
MEQVNSGASKIGKKGWWMCQIFSLMLRVYQGQTAGYGRYTRYLGGVNIPWISVTLAVR